MRRVTGDIIVALVVVAALGFDFTNGFHDTANAMATTIATGALPPKVAVTIAAILNFVGAFISLSVAATVASGIVNADVITPTVVFGDRVEPRDVVVRPALLVLARADRGRHGLDARRGRQLGDRGRGDPLQGHRPGDPVADPGRVDRING